MISLVTVNNILLPTVNTIQAFFPYDSFRVFSFLPISKYDRQCIFFIHLAKNKMSRAAAINKFKDILSKLFIGIENILRFQTIDTTTWMEHYTYGFIY